MYEEVQSLLNDYWKWMKDRTVLEKVKDGFVEITTPYLDRHNDNLQIYVGPKGDVYRLTDDSYILHDLNNSGFTIDTPRRKELLDQIVNGYGVRIEKNELFVEASRADFPTRKQDLIQAMLAINDLYYTSRKNVADMFYEDVSSWLYTHDVAVSERVRLTGKSGYSHHIDFLFPEIKKRKVPERALQVVNNPQKDSFARVLMIKNDLQMRNLDVFMIINDQRGRGNMVSDLVNASHEYDIEPILWSKRDEMSHALFA